MFYPLGTLELQFNELSEVLPLSLFNLANLVTLRVNDNQILGTIPATVAQMTNLAEIWMNSTSIGGTLPESLYTLPKLTNLNLGGADFSGTLSERVGALSELRFLKIQDNGFSGSLPVSLNNLTRLSKNSYTCCFKWVLCECAYIYHLILFLCRRLASSWKRPCRYDINGIMRSQRFQLFRSSKPDSRLRWVPASSLVP